MGDGSGVSLPRAVQLQLAVARALIRRPRLLLVDDADQFYEALGGSSGFPQLLTQLCRWVGRAGGGGEVGW